MNISRFLIFVIYLLISHSSETYAKQYSIKVIDNGGRIEINGRIYKGLANDLSNLIQLNQGVSEVVITSYGGSTSESSKVARILNQAELKLLVNTKCASACVYLWAATNRRYLDKSALIGLHQGVPIKKAPGVLEIGLNVLRRKILDDILRQAGFSEQMIERTWSVSPNSALWLTYDDLAKDGVKFHLTTNR